MNKVNDSDDSKRHVVANFNALAETYDAVRFVQICAHRLAERMTLTPGTQVLDVATGTGWAAMAAAQHVGPHGRVLGVDLATELLEHAKQKVAAAGLTNIEFLVGDAERLDIADESFDVVLCASGLFFVPDMLAALKEWHRVLKPGGRVGFSGFGPTFRQPLMNLWDARLQQYGVSGPTFSPIERLAKPETCRRLLQEAGFVQSEVICEQLGYYFQSAEEWWNEEWSSLSRLDILHLSASQLEQFRSEHQAEVQRLATDQGIWIELPVNFAHGLKL